MLHNIKINAGQHTEIAKQGKFINVVLAAGEIEARIRLNNNQTFQTSLVSGMAFPVPQGFQSASFSSDTSQQTKIWLSDLPLTYTSLDSRVVGSNAIESKSAKVAFGSPTQLLAAQAGRGKSIISASEDIKIGGVNVSPSSAVNIPANVPFEISTQGALFAYSDNPANSGGVVVAPENGAFNSVDSGFLSVSGKVTYCDKDDELLVLSNSSIYRYKATDFSLIQELSVIAHGSFARYDDVSRLMRKRGNDYYSFVSKNGETSLIKYNSETKGITAIKVADAGGTVKNFAIDFDGERSCVLVTLGDGTLQLYHGTLSSWALYVLPDFGVFGAAVVSLVGADYIAAYGLQNMVESTDNGVTFGAVKPIGHNLSGFVVHDKQTGYYYTKTNTNLIKRSLDGVDFLDDVYQSADNIYTFMAAGGHLYGAGDDVLIYSPDSGATWVRWTLAELTGDDGLNSVYSIDVSPSGFLYVFNYTNREIYRFGGNFELVGGLDVAIMSEVN